MLIYTVENVGQYPFAEIFVTEHRGYTEVETVTGPGICTKADRRLAMKTLERRGIIARADVRSPWVLQGMHHETTL